MNSVSYTFSILKGTWGIWMDVEGSVHHDFTVTPQDNEIQPDVFLRLEIHLSEELVPHMINGFRWVLSENPQSQPILIVIERWDFAWCDFQLEGVFYAAAGWLSKALGLQEREIRFSFSKEENKYLFLDKEYDQ